MGLKPKERELLNWLREVAQEQSGEKVERKEHFTEFTGIIGELAFCKKYDYTWDPSFGYDVRKGEDIIQIKTRKLWSSDNFKAGRMGRFGRKGEYHFKTDVLVLLGKTFEIEGVWKADVEDIIKWENNTKSGLHVSTFIKDPKKLNKCVTAVMFLWHGTWAGRENSCPI